MWYELLGRRYRRFATITLFFNVRPSPEELLIYLEYYFTDIFPYFNFLFEFLFLYSSMKLPIPFPLGSSPVYRPVFVSFFCSTSVLSVYNNNKKRSLPAFALSGRHVTYACLCLCAICGRQERPSCCFRCSRSNKHNGIPFGVFFSPRVSGIRERFRR